MKEKVRLPWFGGSDERVRCGFEIPVNGFEVQYVQFVSLTDCSQQFNRLGGYCVYLFWFDVAYFFLCGGFCLYLVMRWRSSGGVWRARRWWPENDLSGYL